MRVVCISDTHGHHREIQERLPPGDIIVHAGDFCKFSTNDEIKNFRHWFRGLDYEHKVLVAGNHDVGLDARYVPHPSRHWQSSSSTRMSAKFKFFFEESGIIYLQDSSKIIEGYKFYGAPWQPVFYDWAFQLERKEIAQKWSLIPGDVDFLVTHCPPEGILDTNENDERTGCPELLSKILSLKTGPIFHVFGHIHEGYGVSQIGDTTFVNAAICDIRYRPSRDPVVVELP